MAWLDACWYLVGFLTDAGPAGLVAGTAVVGLLWVAAIATRALLRRPAAPDHSVASPRDLRERLTLSRVVRQRDPDASGRSRPRAPSAAPAAG